MTAVELYRQEAAKRGLRPALPLAEVARRAGLTEVGVLYRIRAGHLPAVRAPHGRGGWGWRYEVPREAADAFIAERQALKARGLKRPRRLSTFPRHEA